MKKVCKLFVDFDKEEIWLNHMAAEGHLVRKAGPLYSFTPIAPGSAVVRIDYRPSMNAADFPDYKLFFSDAGWQHLSGSRTSGNQYFASTGRDENDEIFSEAGSKAQRYRRALGVNVSLTVSFLVVLIILWSSGSAMFDTLLSPGEWYLTPGLWETHGWGFLLAFLVETPFVALRVGVPILLIAGCLVMLGMVAYQSILYRRGEHDLQGRIVRSVSRCVGTAQAWRSASCTKRRGHTRLGTHGFRDIECGFRRLMAVFYDWCVSYLMGYEAVRLRDTYTFTDVGF